jgi:hypothetical protein
VKSETIGGIGEAIQPHPMIAKFLAQRMRVKAARNAVLGRAADFKMAPRAIHSYEIYGKSNHWLAKMSFNTHKKMFTHSLLYDSNSVVDLIVVNFERTESTICLNGRTNNSPPQI